MTFLKLKKTNSYTIFRANSESVFVVDVNVSLGVTTGMLTSVSLRMTARTAARWTGKPQSDQHIQKRVDP
jgi:hypothetical protein